MLTPGFVMAYLRAYQRMVETGLPQVIEGFHGWKVTKPKEDLQDK